MAFKITNVRQAGSDLISIEVEFSNGERGVYEFNSAKWNTDTILAEIAAVEAYIEQNKTAPLAVFSLKGQTFSVVSK